MSYLRFIQGFVIHFDEIKLFIRGPNDWLAGSVSSSFVLKLIRKNSCQVYVGHMHMNNAGDII